MRSLQLTRMVMKRSLEMLSLKHSQQSPRKQITHLKVREERIPMKHIPLLPQRELVIVSWGHLSFVCLQGFQHQPLAV